MNWYKTSQKQLDFSFMHQEPWRVDPVKKSLTGLAYEALKYDTFEEFEKAYSGDIKHGEYWHFTKDPNFFIDPDKGPTDASSMSISRMPDVGKIMITSDPDYWDRYYNFSGHGKTRPWVAEIDMSQVSPNLYYQVQRGFGNELIVLDASQARTKRVLPVEQARKIWRRNAKLSPKSQDELRRFYEQVWKLRGLGRI